MLPPTEYEILLNKLQEKFQCYNFQYIHCNCNSNYDIDYFPKLTFNIDGNSYTINPINYVHYKRGEKSCLLSITNSRIESYYLGSPFFYEYYAVFDMSNRL